jgi:hypothetical protein
MKDKKNINVEIITEETNTNEEETNTNEEETKKQPPKPSKAVQEKNIYIENRGVSSVLYLKDHPEFGTVMLPGSRGSGHYAVVNISEKVFNFLKVNNSNFKNDLEKGNIQRVHMDV